MNNELSKDKILKMVEEKSITAEQGMQMLKELSSAMKNEKKDLHSLLQQELLDAAALILKIEPSKLNVGSEFRDFGFDSISLANFNNYIIDCLGFDIDPYMYFEYTNIEQLAKGLIEKYPSELMKYFNISETEMNEEVEVELEDVMESAAGIKKDIQWNVNYEYSSIWLLDIQKDFPKDRMLTFWNDISNNGGGDFQLSNVSLEQLKMFEESGLKYKHLLVESYLNTKVEVIIAGSGKPILYINPVGMTAPACIFQMEELSKEHQFILINAPGCGLSELIEDLTFSNICKLYFDITNKLGIKEPVHVVGISWGGLLAQGMANEYSDKLASMTLVGTTSIHKGDEEPEDKNKRLLIKDFRNIGKEDDYKYVQMGGGISKETFKAYTQNYVNDETALYQGTDYLKNITIPTLIISGEKDIVINKKESQLLSEQIKNSIYCEIEGAGHCPFLTHYEEFNKAVIDFIDKLG